MSDTMPADILLVEDNKGDVRLLQEAFKDGKIVVNLHVVGDGVEALAFLHREGKHKDAPRPDMILLDLNLPKKDGREVLSEVKNDVKLKRIPIVVLTTSSSGEDILRSYDAYANCYITKPVDMDQFVSVIKSLENFWLTLVKLPKQD